MNSTLRNGSQGEDVRRLQLALNDSGASPTLLDDGIFGPATESAVRTYQEAAGLQVDGVVGPETWRSLVGLIAGLTLEDLLILAADPLDVDLPSVLALVEVESSGSGFLPDGRPSILFERHVMRRRMIARGMNTHRAEAERPDLVNATPGGYRGGAREHERLEAAKRIHRDAAIESASWGLFQIMGHHWQALGYNSARHWESKMSEDAAEHVIAFVKFIQADPRLHQALRRRDWQQVARRYNGPAYERNSYDQRLAAAYERHQGVTA